MYCLSFILQCYIQLFFELDHKKFICDCPKLYFKYYPETCNYLDFINNNDDGIIEHVLNNIIFDEKNTKKLINKLCWFDSEKIYKIIHIIIRNRIDMHDYFFESLNGGFGRLGKYDVKKIKYYFERNKKFKKN